MSDAASAVSKRRHERMRTELLGRYMLADGREAKCAVRDVSLGGVALAAPERGAIGENVVVYVDQIGRLRGRIVRYIDGGFALALDVSTLATQRLAQRLRDVANGGRKPAPAGRN